MRNDDDDPIYQVRKSVPWDGKGGGRVRTVLVGDSIGLCRREILRYLTLKVLLLLLDHHELFSQQDNGVARALLGIAPASEVAHERCHHGPSCIAWMGTRVVYEVVCLNESEQSVIGFVGRSRPGARHSSLSDDQIRQLLLTL